MLAENDDAKERDIRRKSRIRSTSQLMVTPIAVSHDQLRDIYATCIKLSAENKITKQNAFGLQLIDYMQEVLQQIKGEDGTNFQLASCTLDAGVKIYGHRVDSVHLDAFRIAGTLGHGTDMHGSKELPVDQEIPNNDPTEAGKSAKIKKVGKNQDRHAHSKIESNLKNIYIDKLDLDEESNLWNVVFARRPISNAFGRSGPDSYILNTYNISCDFGAIVLDPLKIPFLEYEITCNEHVKIPSQIFQDVVDVMDDRAKIKMMGILDNFSFTGWSSPSKPIGIYQNIIPYILNNESTEHISNDEYDDESLVKSFMDQDMNYSCNDAGAQLTDISQPLLPINAVESANINNFIFALAQQPTEYSYFNTINPLNINMNNFGAINLINFDLLKKSKHKVTYTEKKIRAKNSKAYRDDDFDDDLNNNDLKRLFSSSYTKRLNLKIHKSKNYSITTVEPIIGFESNYLFLLFVNNKACLYLDGVEKIPKIVDQQPINSSINYEGEEYNDFDEGAFETQENNPHYTNNMNLSLIAQPVIVNRLFIKYAKVAKRLDSKAVKSYMWKLIENNSHPKGIFFVT
ncbi:hypothetical protein MXB_781 [Myxobolus squamalis]|nr:hypothetical protein MXB_781 [Myxobolus squamalis]